MNVSEEITDDPGGSVSYGYSYVTLSGKTLDRTTVTAFGAATTVLSDMRGNRISIQDPDAGTVTSEYDALNRITGTTDANGNRTDYEYDIIGRVTRKVLSNGNLSDAVEYTYDNADSLYYVLADHLGSWEKVMDDDKNTVQQAHFDPWGNRMGYTAWDTPQTQVSFPFSRGFTGHEHYDRFKIVNANARLYDPTIGRFFSPDPFVQVPDFTQSYNRYSYCFNNPVMYVDPTGLVLISWNRRQHPDGPLKQVMIDGHTGFVLPEVTITPSDESPNYFEEFEFTPYSGGNAGYNNGYWNNGNVNGTTIRPGRGGSGGNIRGGIKHSTPENTACHDNNIELASKTLTSINLYTTIESNMYYNSYLRTWRDKHDVVRSMDFHGNQYTGGMNSYGKKMSMKFTKATGWLNGIGIGLSVYEIMLTKNEIDRVKYSTDILIGSISFMPGGGIISAFWFLGGRNLVFLYGENMGNLIENGINPGLLEYQPFK